MKKVIVILSFCALILSSRHAFAQYEYDKGDVLINAGLGFGYFYASGVPVTASVEFAITDAISVGPYLGFTGYRYNFLGYKYNYTFIDIGARGSYHFSKHIDMNTDKLDLYGAVLLGYTISSFSGDDAPGYSDNYPSIVKFGLAAGARWYFTDRFAVNGEVGYGIAPLMLGVTFKL
jgi:hypothetical protein